MPALGKPPPGGGKYGSNIGHHFGFFHGVSGTLVLVGLKHSNNITAVLISQVSCLFFCLSIASFNTSLGHFISRAVLYFTVAGIMGPLIARFLLYTGIERVGASVATPVHNSKILFSAIAAVLILGERFTVPMGLGAGLILIGVIAISSDKSGGQKTKWSRWGIIFPIMAGACRGVSHVFRKMGLNIVPDCIVGVTVQNVTALAFFPLLYMAQRQKVVFNDKRAWFIFSLAGLSATIGQLFLFYALNLGQVVIVAPLTSLGPLFVLLLIRIFLKELERVTWKIVSGALLIIGGAAVLTLI